MKARVIAKYAMCSRPFLLTLLWMLSIGCSGTSLNEPKAHDACVSFLTTWKEGKHPDDLKPNIIGRDDVWASGTKLVSFEILPGENKDGINLSVPVRLTLQDDKGQESKSDVTYVVATSPVVTVFRLSE